MNKINIDREMLYISFIGELRFDAINVMLTENIIDLLHSIYAIITYITYWHKKSKS